MKKYTINAMITKSPKPSPTIHPVGNLSESLLIIYNSKGNKHDLITVLITGRQDKTHHSSIDRIRIKEYITRNDIYNTLMSVSTMKKTFKCGIYISTILYLYIVDDWP